MSTSSLSLSQQMGSEVTEGGQRNQREKRVVKRALGYRFALQFWREKVSGMSNYKAGEGPADVGRRELEGHFALNAKSTTQGRAQWSFFITRILGC